MITTQLAEQSSDSELIVASRERGEVFAQLFDWHSDAVFRYAARRLGAQAAEDLADETFLVAAIPGGGVWTVGATADDASETPTVEPLIARHPTN